jgi:hypothetical protein
MLAPGIFTTPNRKMPPNSRKGVIQHKPGQFFILRASRVSPLSQIRQITNQRGNFGVSSSIFYFIIKINNLTQKPAYQYLYIRAGAIGINSFGLALNVVAQFG